MTLPLFPSESEIAAMVMGKRAKEWPAKARYLEDKHGLPRVDELMGGRYWPAVVDYFRIRHGMELPSGNATPKMPVSNRVRVVPFKPDGRDNFNGQDAPTAFDRRHSHSDHR